MPRLAAPTGFGTSRLDRRPIVILILASSLWGAAVTGTKYALQGFDPFALLLVELLAATLVLWAVLLIRGYRPPRSWKLAVVLGLLEPGTAYLAETFGLSRTGAADGAIVCGLESAFVVVLAVAVLRERVTRAMASAVALALVGLVVLQGGNPLQGSGLGDLFVAVGVLSASGYTVLVKRFSGEPDALALTACQFTAGTVLALLVVGTRWLTGAGGLPTGAAPRFWWAAGAVGVFGYGASFILFNSTISRISAGAASIVLNLIPIFGVVTAIVFLRESLKPATAVGAVLIAGSVMCFVLLEGRARATARPASPSAEEGWRTAQPIVAQAGPADGKVQPPRPGDIALR